MTDMTETELVTAGNKKAKGRNPLKTCHKH